MSARPVRMSLVCLDRSHPPVSLINLAAEAPIMSEKEPMRDIVLASFSNRTSVAVLTFLSSGSLTPQSARTVSMEAVA